MTKIKADKPVLNFNGNEFIPIACHYNENTLLTKNGQLIQIICIDDINKLGNGVTGSNDIREVLRNAIQKHVNSNKFSFWISTVRSAKNINGDSAYEIQLSKDIEEAWRNKNHLDKKFVNSLYVSIIYHNASLEINNLSGFVNSLSGTVINNFHNKYLENSIVELNGLSGIILEELKIFKPKQLKIFIKDNQFYSELQSFIEKLIYFTQNDVLLNERDISIDLAPHSYAVGNDKIEVEYKDYHKFASVISLKEYQEIPSQTLGAFLEIPCEMIITETLILIDKKQAVSSLKFTNYIASVSKDEDMADILNIKEMIDETGQHQFCSQQINISVVEKSLQKIEKNLVRISKSLSQLGIVNVKEDINIEYAFWSRIPGNFHLIKRASPILKNKAAAFSALYSFPTGNFQSIWGSAVTILPTFKNTSYFFNFHSGDSGHTAVFSMKNYGKTVMLNFLISMATKYNPEILYLSHSSKSEAFLELIGSKYLNHLSLPNPLIYLNESEILQWLRILCGDKTNKLSKSEVDLLSDIVKYLLDIPAEERILQKIMNFDFSKYQDIASIKSRLDLFCVNGKYEHLVFDNNVEIDKICGFELSFFTNKSFELENYPKQEKLIPDYLADLEVHIDIRSAVMFLLINVFCQKNSKQPKILALSDLDCLISAKHFEDEIEHFCEVIRQNNGILISSININNYKQFHGTKFWKIFLEQLATTIVMSGDSTMENFKACVNFDDAEMALFRSIPQKGKFCILKQRDFTVSAELNLIDFPWITKILSQGSHEKAIYKEIKNSQPRANILSKLYEAFK
jgi:type IV secretion system protein VirB4